MATYNINQFNLNDSSIFIDLVNYYDKKTVDKKIQDMLDTIGSAYNIIGNLADLDELLTLETANIGDVYNITNSFNIEDVIYEAHTNMVCINTINTHIDNDISKWLPIGSTFNTENYYNKQEVDERLTEVVIDNLVTTDVNRPLSANMGHELNSVITEVQTKVNDLTTIEITYQQLVNYRNNAKLIPGKFYIISDYITTTSQENTLSTNHSFDIIIQALSNNKLSENAKALPKKLDSYFKNADMSAWELKYCIDNDTDRFSWASETGTGVIYYMKDEYNNEAWYDFKNIQFLRDSQWMATYKQSYPALQNNFNDEDYYFYTFSKIKVNDDGTNLIQDGTLNVLESTIKPAHNNIIGRSALDNSKRFVLNNTIFISKSFPPHDNNIASDNQNNTLGNKCCYNTIGQYFRDNIIAGTFQNNIIEQRMTSCQTSNTFEHTKVGPNAWHNKWLEPISYCTFGSYFQYNSVISDITYTSTGGLKYCNFGSNNVGCDYIPSMTNVDICDSCWCTEANFFFRQLKLYSDGGLVITKIIGEHESPYKLYRVDGNGVDISNSYYMICTNTMYKHLNDINNGFYCPDTGSDINGMLVNKNDGYNVELTVDNGATTVYLTETSIDLKAQDRNIKIDADGIDLVYDRYNSITVSENHIAMHNDEKNTFVGITNNEGTLATRGEEHDEAVIKVSKDNVYLSYGDQDEEPASIYIYNDSISISTSYGNSEIILNDDMISLSAVNNDIEMFSDGNVDITGNGNIGMFSTNNIDIYSDNTIIMNYEYLKLSSSNTRINVGTSDDYICDGLHIELPDRYSYIHYQYMNNYTEAELSIKTDIMSIDSNRYFSVNSLNFKTSEGFEYNINTNRSISESEFKNILYKQYNSIYKENDNALCIVGTIDWLNNLPEPVNYVTCVINNHMIRIYYHNSEYVDGNGTIKPLYYYNISMSTNQAHIETNCTNIELIKKIGVYDAFNIIMFDIKYVEQSGEHNYVHEYGYFNTKSGSLNILTGIKTVETFNYQTNDKKYYTYDGSEWKDGSVDTGSDQL